MSNENGFKIFEDKNLSSKLDKIKKQILYKEELDRIKEREKRYLEKKSRGEII